MSRNSISFDDCKFISVFGNVQSLKNPLRGCYDAFLTRFYQAVGTLRGYMGRSSGCVRKVRGRSIAEDQKFIFSTLRHALNI